MPRPKVDGVEDIEPYFENWSNNGDGGLTVVSDVVNVGVVVFEGRIEEMEKGGSDEDRGI